MPYGPGLWKMTSQFQDETQKSIVGNNFESGFMRFGILPRLFATGFLSSYLNIMLTNNNFCIRTPETPHDMLYIHVYPTCTMYILYGQCI